MFSSLGVFYREILNVIDDMCSFRAVPVSNFRVAHICNVLFKHYKLYEGK